MKKILLLILACSFSNILKAYTIINNTTCTFVVHVHCTPDCNSFESSPQQISIPPGFNSTLINLCPPGPPPSVTTYPNFVFCWDATNFDTDICSPEDECTYPFYIGPCGVGSVGWQVPCWDCGQQPGEKIYITYDPGTGTYTIFTGP